MKYLFIVFLLLFETSNCSSYSIKEHIIKNLKYGNIPVKSRRVDELAKAIEKYSKKYQIPAKIFVAILMQESTYLIDAKNCNKEIEKEVKNPYITNLIAFCDFKYYGKEFEKCLLDIPIYITIKEKKCTDFGVSQIHEATAKLKAYNFDIERLTKDLDYSVECGVKVLNYFHKKYAKKEKNWWVRYNCGEVKDIDNNKYCNEYKKLVERFL